MHKVILCNAFSLNMLGQTNLGYAMGLLVERVSLEDARSLATEAASAVGHADTAAVFSQVLGVTVPHARVNVFVGRGDRLLVGQYVGPRLPEGATALPDGARVDWFLVTFEN